MEPTVKNKKRSWLIPLVVLIVAVLAGGGYLLYGYLHPYNFHYSKLSAYSLADNKHHAGMSVLKPEEFKLQSDVVPPRAKILQSAAQARFAQQKTISGKQATIAQLAINSIFTPSELKSMNTQLVDRLMTDVKDPGHQAVVLPLQNYANNLLNPNVASPIYNLSFAEPAALKNLSHAWMIDFQAAAKNSNRTTPDMQGVVIEVFGKNGHYLMALDAAKANWQSNQKVWQQVINSLEVDQ